MHPGDWYKWKCKECLKDDFYPAELISLESYHHDNKFESKSR